jgi:hypothetical protein
MGRAQGPSLADRRAARFSDSDLPVAIEDAAETAQTLRGSAKLRRERDGLVDSSSDEASEAAHEKRTKTPTTFLSRYA